MIYTLVPLPKNQMLNYMYFEQYLKNDLKSIQSLSKMNEIKFELFLCQLNLLTGNKLSIGCKNEVMCI